MQTPKELSRESDRYKQPEPELSTHIEERLTKDVTDSIDESQKADLLTSLERSEARLRMAMESTGLGTWDYDLITGELIWSDECRTIYGIDPGVKIDFALFTRHIYPEDKDRVEHAIRKALDAGGDGSYKISYRILRADTLEPRWIQAHGKVYFNEEGRAVRFLGTVLDITDVKQAEEKAAILAAIIRSSDDAIISKNLDGIITSWNDSAQRMFGYTAGEIVGKSILTVIPEDRQHEEVMILSRLRKGERIEHFETKRITKDGRLIDLSLTISPVKDSHGNIIGVSKIARDITGLKLAEEKAAKLAAIVESSDDAIISKTLEGIITSWNDSAQRLFGYKAEEIIGKSILTLIPEDRQEEEAMILSRLRRGERVEHFETKRITKDKRIIDLSLTISPVRDPHGRIIGLSKIARDITAKKQEEVRKNDFIAIVSHELKTPLTSVKSYIQVLLAKALKDGSDFTINALSRAEVQTNKMTYMINDFLSLARLEEGKIHLNKERFELHQLMEDLTHDAQFFAAGHIIRLHDCEKLVVNADKDKISQVLINLLSNAIKYSPKGSTVTIGCAKHSGMIKIYVTDEGVGINPMDQKRLFERFYRVENEKMKTVSGFGIGLYLVAEILKLHHSKIVVESEPGKGSTFWFELKAEEAH